MMTKLRDLTAPIIVLVIIAFVGLIVIEWGADYSRGSRTGDGSTVGVVNGEKISFSQFQMALSNAARQRPRDQREARGEIIREVWEAFVRNIVLKQQIEQLGIQATDAELAHYLRYQPPAVVQNIEVFQTNGEFDLMKYNQFLNDPAVIRDPSNKAFIMQVEDMIEEQLLNYKLQRMLIETVQVSPVDVREYYAAQHERVEVEYVYAPAQEIADEAVVIDEVALTAYYRERRENFRHPAQVRLEYVYFPKVATARDSTRIAGEIEHLRQELEAGADFAELAMAISEDEGSAQNGGDLGVFGRGRMVAPFDEAVFSLKEGEISEPVQTAFGWHLIKLEERLQEDGEEQVRARHILLRFKASRQTEEALEEQAEEFKRRAEAEGFRAAAAAQGSQPRDSGYLTQGSPIVGLGPGTAWMVNWFFDSKAGKISDVAGNENGFWVAHLSEKRDAGIAPLDEVRLQLERELRYRKKTEKVAERLETVRQQALDGAELASVAQEAGFEAQRPASFTRRESVPGIGRQNAFTNAAFRLPPGELEVVLLPPRGAYLLRVIDKVPVDEERLAAEKESITQQLLRQRQEEMLQNWFTHVFEAAEIEDYRHRFGLAF